MRFEVPRRASAWTSRAPWGPGREEEDPLLPEGAQADRMRRSRIAPRWFAGAPPVAETVGIARGSILDDGTKHVAESRAAGIVRTNRLDNGITSI